MFPAIVRLLMLAAAANAALTYVGVDWSSVLVEEKRQVSYKDVSGKAMPLEQILKSNGVDTVRQRIWVTDGDYGNDYNIKLAQRAKAAGLNVYLDLHYSNSWADPGKQYAPSGWPSEVEALATKVYDYTKSLCDSFEQAGVRPVIISIGNEIRSGLLWPTGRTSNFGNIARLLKAASKAIKESTLNPKPKIMIHLDNGWDWNAQRSWYTSLLSANGGTFTLSDFDQMGVSYYPFYGSGATLSSLKSSLNNMAKQWSKDIIVAEVNWPQSCSRAGSFPSDLKSIPFSAAGQVEFLTKVASAMDGLPNVNSTGLFYWEPAWLGNAGLGSSCESNTMFTSSGTALSSMSVFSQI
ncbi:glycoside hydrolase family 53 protein [Nemania abortiva]|nr:glycoside hydrolase family 53 protein [Nemania abortiva]